LAKGGGAAASALEHSRGPDTPPGVRAFLDTWDPTLNDPLAVAAVLRRPANPELAESDVSAITAPVCVVNGSDDFVTTMGTRLLAALDTQPQILPGFGHFDLTGQAQLRETAMSSLGE